jgi:hypothetical protein
MLLTAMFVVSGILVQAPTIFIDPHTHINWVENVLNFALIASAWVIAASIEPMPAPIRKPLLYAMRMADVRTERYGIWAQRRDTPAEKA